jgi:hypothetical protein
MHPIGRGVVIGITLHDSGATDEDGLLWRRQGLECGDLRDAQRLGVALLIHAERNRRLCTFRRSQFRRHLCAALRYWRGLSQSELTTSKTPTEVARNRANRRVELFSSNATIARRESYR